MKKVLLIVPDGVAVRNYLYSSFINELQGKGVEVILYHQISDSAIVEVQKVQKNISKIKRIPSFVESPKARILRESLAYARLLHNRKVLRNKAIMAFWNKSQKGWKQKILYSFSELLGTILSKSYSFILKFDKKYDNEILKSGVISSITKDFDFFKPDLVLNLHQRAPVSAPIIAVAKQKNIKTATVIFSWDNVPKARLISRYDAYLVWSDLMKDELSLLYSEIDKGRIQVVGTPQFEFYFQEKFIKSKTDFFKEYGLDIHKKTICFSANDMTSPYEANYLEDICEEISKIAEHERPQLLFRRCPVDKSKRFDNVLEKYKKVVFSIDPDWRIENSLNASFNTIYPAYNDISLLVNTVKHSDVVINFGSTMAHDFAVYDKPCLYLNYDPVKNSTFKVKMCYGFQHFKSMEGLEAVGWINSKSDIISKIKVTFNNPEKVGADRKKWIENIVLSPLNDNTKIIANTLDKLI